MSGIRSRGRRGSTAVPNWRCEDIDLDPYDFRVACWLASHADSYLADSVNRNAIAKVLSMSRERVSKALARLVQLEIISIIEVPSRGGGHDKFEIEFDFSEWERSGPSGVNLRLPTPRLDPEQGRQTTLTRTPDDLEVGRHTSLSIGEQEEGRELSKESSRGELEVVRPRNQLFDACVLACGWEYEEMTERQRKACGVAVGQLKAVCATPYEILRRAAIYKQVYPNAALTPNALANQWAAISKVQDSGPRLNSSSAALMRAYEQAAKRGSS